MSEPCGWMIVRSEEACHGVRCEKKGIVWQIMSCVDISLAETASRMLCRDHAIELQQIQFKLTNSKDSGFIGVWVLIVLGIFAIGGLIGGLQGKQEKISDTQPLQIARKWTR